MTDHQDRINASARLLVRTHLSHVGVGGLCVDASVGLDVLEGVVHESALASVVSEGSAAVDEVLLGQRHELAGLLEVLPLERAGGAEGPAGAALLLQTEEGEMSRLRIGGEAEGAGF